VTESDWFLFFLLISSPLCSLLTAKRTAGYTVTVSLILVLILSTHFFSLMFSFLLFFYAEIEEVSIVKTQAVPMEDSIWNSFFLNGGVRFAASTIVRSDPNLRTDHCNCLV
jgi:hypothetical protein